MVLSALESSQNTRISLLSYSICLLGTKFAIYRLVARLKSTQILVAQSESWKTTLKYIRWRHVTNWSSQTVQHSRSGINQVHPQGNGSSSALRTMIYGYSGETGTWSLVGYTDCQSMCFLIHSSLDGAKVGSSRKSRLIDEPTSLALIDLLALLALLALLTISCTYDINTEHL